MKNFNITNYLVSKGTLVKITFVVLCFSFLSCATLFNTKRDSIVIVHDKEITQLHIDSCVKILPNGFCVNRSPYPRKLDFMMDGKKKSLFIQPRKSFTYWQNVLNLGFGFLIDKNTTKRFSYPKRIYLEKSDTVVKQLSLPTLKKGTVQLCILFPYINTFYIRSPKGHFTSSGFLGVGIGLNYFYKNNKYLSINGGISLDSPLPVPAAIDYMEEHQSASITFVNIRNHYIYGKFDLGYGFSFSESLWKTTGPMKYETDSTYVNNTKSQLNSGLGLSLNAKYSLKRRISFGLLYQPTLINLNHTPRFDYQHFISIEAAFRFNVRKG